MKLKLSDKQKEVIKYLYKAGTSIIWHWQSQAYSCNDRRLNKSDFNKLHILGLIEYECTCFSDNFFKLSELGKTIEL